MRARILRLKALGWRSQAVRARESPATDSPHSDRFCAFAAPRPPIPAKFFPRAQPRCRSRLPARVGAVATRFSARAAEQRGFAGSAEVPEPQRFLAFAQNRATRAAFCLRAHAALRSRAPHALRGGACAAPR
jgi:hypothetical protein